MEIKVPFDVHRQVVDRVIELVNLGNAHYNINAPYPFIHYDPPTVAAGDCTPSVGRIGFNPWLLVHNVERFLVDTVPHETAHYLEYHVSGKVEILGSNPHNQIWYQIMNVLGAQYIGQNHSYDLSVIPGLHTQYTYKCGCTTYRIPIKTHRKIQAKLDSYNCTSCGNTIQYDPPWPTHVDVTQYKKKKDQLALILQHNSNMNKYEFVDYVTAKGYSTSTATKIWQNVRSNKINNKIR